MARKWIRWTRVSSLVVTGCFLGAALTGVHPLPGQNNGAPIKQTSLSDATAAFTARLEQRIANSRELQEAISSSEDCVEEVAALIIADLALQQAQHDRDAAEQALDDCLMSLPEPEPEPPAEVRPIDGEFSVLVR